MGGVVATSSHNGLMAKEDKLKLDKISLLDTQRTEEDGTITTYTVPNYYDIYEWCAGAYLIENKKTGDTILYIESWLSDAYRALTTEQNPNPSDQEVIKWGIDNGHLNSSQIDLEKVEIVKQLNLYCRGVQVGKFLISHEVVMVPDTNTVDRHQLVVATDADEDGQSDFVFTIPGDLESRLSKLETNTTNLQSQVEVLEAKDVTTANFDKVKVSINQLNAFMTNFATISSSNNWRTYTLADSSVTSIASSSDSVSLDTAMNLFSKAVNAKINSITPTP